MRNVNYFRQYATAMGLLLVLLLVSLWLAGMLPGQVWPEAEPGSSVTRGEFPCCTIADDCALLPATTPRQGSLRSWPGSNDACLLCSLCLRVHRPVSRAPPGVSCPPDSSDASRCLLGTLGGLLTGGRGDIAQGRQDHAAQGHRLGASPVSGVSRQARTPFLASRSTRSVSQACGAVSIPMCGL
jgi:hypothetical protein